METLNNETMQWQGISLIQSNVTRKIKPQQWTLEAVILQVGLIKGKRHGNSSRSKDYSSGLKET